MGLVGISRKNKMKNFHLPKISLLVQVGQIRYKQHYANQLWMNLYQVIRENWCLYLPTYSLPISTDRLIFGIFFFFHLVLSEYANQYHNFTNLNLMSHFSIELQCIIVRKLRTRIIKAVFQVE